MPVASLDLNTRRKKLKMPVEALVRRSGVPRPTVFRILLGKIETVRFGHVQKVAMALGVPLGATPVDPDQLRLQEAHRKAGLLRRLTQGTMALESQALTNDVARELEQQTVAKLLAGSGRKLWSD